MDPLARLGFLRLAYWLYARAQTLNPVVVWHNAHFRPVDRLPVPPGFLVSLVAGTPDIGWFFTSGRLAAESIDQILKHNGIHMNQLHYILDFGCGCGRVIRHLRALTGGKLYGSDYDVKLIDWCRENLSSIGEFSANKFLPPLSYSAGSFDLIYGLSVFTHMAEGTQLAWVGEFARLLRSQGLLVFSTHGESYLNRLTRKERERFKSGELVVKRREYEGTNLCTAFHPPQYVERQLSRGFSVVDFRQAGARGNPDQDLYLLRRTRN